MVENVNMPRGVEDETRALLLAAGLMATRTRAEFAECMRRFAAKWADEDADLADFTEAVFRLLARINANETARDRAAVRAYRAERRKRYGAMVERCEPVQGPTCADDAAQIAEMALAAAEAD